MNYYLIYTSYTTYPWNDDSLSSLLHTSVVNCKEMDITGMLVYVGNRFIQMLEGEEKVVHELFKEIAKDSRHDRVTTVLEGYNQDRLFKDWSMGFKKVSDLEFEDISGYKNLEELFPENHVDEKSHPALIFLRHFYKTNLRDYMNIEF